jgi:two-component system, OmpR family, sensor histidine kinase TctE
VAHPSLRRRLLLALMLPLFVLGGASVAWELGVAQRLTDDAYDQALGSTALGLAVRLETDADGDLPAHMDAAMRAMARIDAPDAWHYLVLDAQGRPLAGDKSLAALTARTAINVPLFSDVSIGDERKRLVTYRHVDEEGDVTVIVAVSLLRRRAAAAGIVWAAIWPNVLLMVFSLLVVFGGVRMVLRPLDALGRRFAGSRVQDLVAVPLGQTPREALPLLNAVNDLMARLRAAAQSQQSFLNQTAHQLRTPLAALQTQLELLRDSLPAAEQPRIEALRASAMRLGRLTHQMLALARAEPGAAVMPRCTVNLVALLEEVATGCDNQARGRGVEIEFDAQHACVEGSAWMLREALVNLIDNAIAHAPKGSCIRVRCGLRPHEPASADARTGAPFLEVCDDGPGIPQADRERVFEPFVQLAGHSREGSGLGLAIVREVAQRHGASVSLTAGADGLGTRASIEFPPFDPTAEQGGSLQQQATTAASSAI